MEKALQMQKKQQKRPYLAPEVVSVEFVVEVGTSASIYDVQLTDPGLQAKEVDGMLMFLSSMQGSDARMGQQMGYFVGSFDDYTGGGPSSVGYFGGHF